MSILIKLFINFFSCEYLKNVLIFKEIRFRRQLNYKYLYATFQKINFNKN